MYCVFLCSSSSASSVSDSKLGEASELKIQLLTKVKENSAMKIELEAIRRELDSKIKVAEAKDHLVETLERVLSKKKEEYGVMLSRFEKTVKEKVECSQKLLLACEKMEDCAKEMSTLRQVKTKLEQSNELLRQTVTMLKTKTAQIVDIAKTKLTKYGEENKMLHETVEKLKSEGKGNIAVENQMATDHVEQTSELKTEEVSERSDKKEINIKGTEAIVNVWLEQLIAAHGKNEKLPPEACHNLEIVLGQQGVVLALQVADIIFTKDHTTSC